MKLYKYLGPDIINKVFHSNEHASFKCSYPKNFNDPYELFLTLDFNVEPEVLAFYSDVIGEIPQLPTTCFSQSPSVVPMWSHYAQNLEGFIIEVDEEKLAAHFPESTLGIVHYQDKPDDSIKGDLYRAHGTAKGRHIYLLHQEVMSAAYFTKSTCWSYELERRMVMTPTEARENDGLILIDIPVECISAIICGPRANAETKRILHEKAESINCSFFIMKIGRSSSVPFFTDFEGNPYTFEDGALSASEIYCESCNEPLNMEAEMCSWCMIDESHKIAAAERNTYRMYAHYGLLEPYLDSMDKVSRKYRKK